MKDCLMLYRMSYNPRQVLTFLHSGVSITRKASPITDTVSIPAPQLLPDTVQARLQPIPEPIPSRSTVAIASVKSPKQSSIPKITIKPTKTSLPKNYACHAKVRIGYTSGNRLRQIPKIERKKRIFPVMLMLSVSIVRENKA